MFRVYKKSMEHTFPFRVCALAWFLFYTLSHYIVKQKNGFFDKYPHFFVLLIV